MPLLLQLDADQPTRFPGHQRRLYLFACRRRACRRKRGSVRALRAVRVSVPAGDAGDVQPAAVHGSGSGVGASDSVGTLDHVQTARSVERVAPPRLGAALFGGASDAGGPPTTATTAAGSGSPLRNPFATSAPPSAAAPAAGNPFTTRTTVMPGGMPTQPPASRTDTSGDLSTTFAQKARISNAPATPSVPVPDPTSHPPPPDDDARAPWPSAHADDHARPRPRPRPYPRHFLDAEYEYLPPTSQHNASATAQANYAALMDVDNTSNARSGGAGGGGDGAGGAEYESAHDATFQRFADTLAHNAEQVLRYEFGGAPLLSSRVDAVGRLFAPAPASASAAAAPTPHVSTIASASAASGADARIPPCARCGAARVFEAQLMPHAIAVLEEEEETGTATAAAATAESDDDDGMAWSTVLIGVCVRDCCGERGGGALHVEEWAGVQWEE